MRTSHGDIDISDLTAIINIIDEIDCTSVLVIGDWNADASKTSSWFHRYVAKFCQENGYIWSSGLHLPDNTFTYVSDAWGSTSWLDHCVATKDGNNIITSISVDYDCHLSDHFPLNINVCCDLAPKLDSTGILCFFTEQIATEAFSTEFGLVRYPL